MWRQEEVCVLYINRHKGNREAYILYLSGKTSGTGDLDHKRKTK